MKHHGRLHEAKVLTVDSEDEDIPVKGTLHAMRQTAKERNLRRREFRKGELLLLNNELQVLEPGDLN